IFRFMGARRSLKLAGNGRKCKVVALRACGLGSPARVWLAEGGHGWRSGSALVMAAGGWGGGGRGGVGGGESGGGGGGGGGRGFGLLGLGDRSLTVATRGRWPTRGRIAGVPVLRGPPYRAFAERDPAL